MKTTISGIIAALASFFALIAVAPPELQNQIPQLFPEHYRGQLVILFGVIAFLSKAYQSKNTQDAKPSSPVTTVSQWNSQVAGAEQAQVVATFGQLSVAPTSKDSLIVQPPIPDPTYMDRSIIFEPPPRP